jgi:hypothetical protein
MNYYNRIHDLLVEAQINEEKNIRQGIRYRAGQIAGKFGIHSTGSQAGPTGKVLGKVLGKGFEAGTGESGQGKQPLFPKLQKPKEHPLVKATKGMSPSTTGLGGGARPIR